MKWKGYWRNTEICKGAGSDALRDLSLHLMDILQNSITAGAGRIEARLQAEAGILVMSVRDNGCGMDRELLERVVDPFTTTRKTRKIGLGIPLLKAAAERASGGLRIDSRKGEGTTVTATFDIRNIDRPPLGDIAETVTGVILANPETNLKLRLEGDGEAFKLDTEEIKERLGEVPIVEYEVLTWIGEYVKEGITAIFGGVLDEIDSGTGRNKKENPG